ncbi:MAG: hypothetical protein NTW86_05930 [Candidatus Sumerlaeota bacterium]|nr:hypothetical protein [Candidatus Sumerlaeota bacterium]
MRQHPPPAGRPPQMVLGMYNATPGMVNGAYDPSNGSLSWGWIMRTNKGAFSVLGT